MKAKTMFSHAFVSLVPDGLGTEQAFNELEEWKTHTWVF